MRVIAGRAKGTTLHVPRTDLRPSMDVVKSAIFSSLAGLIPEGHILDLFAGTGSLGIEALSRGAARVVFVENNSLAVTAIQKNLTKTKLTGEVFALDIFSYLDRFAAPKSFNLIIADPPYAKASGERDFAPELLNNDALHRALVPDGIFVLEHLPYAELDLGERWECIRDKRYGATAVAFLKARS